MWGLHKNPDYYCNHYVLTDCCATCQSLRNVSTLLSYSGLTSIPRSFRSYHTRKLISRFSENGLCLEKITHRRAIRTWYVPYVLKPHLTLW